MTKKHKGLKAIVSTHFPHGFMGVTLGKSFNASDCRYFTCKVWIIYYPTLYMLWGGWL